MSSRSWVSPQRVKTRSMSASTWTSQGSTKVDPIDSANGRTRFQVPDLGDLHISFPPDMRHMQFWSQPGRDFICLEPFFGPNNTVNTDRRMDVPPGQARDFWMRIELEP